MNELRAEREMIDAAKRFIAAAEDMVEQRVSSEYCSALAQLENDILKHDPSYEGFLR